MPKHLSSLLVALLCFAASFLSSPASALIEGTDTQRVSLRDAQTSGSVVWSPKFQQRGDGLYAKSGTERLWIQLPPTKVGSGKRPPREVTVTTTFQADGFHANETNAFVRYSADGTNWSTWSAMRVSKQTADALIFEERLVVPRIQRPKFDARLNEWMAKGGDAREEQDVFVNSLKRREPELMKTEIPYVRLLEVRIEVDKQPRLGLARGVVVESHWVARIEGE